MTSTESGWSNNDLGFAWFSTILEPNTYSGRSRVLIMDGHGSHLTWHFVRFAADHDIILACFFLHTSHFLQFLDKGVFALESHWLFEKLFHFFFASTDAPISRKMLECIVRARTKGLTKRNIRSVWKKTGIWPPNLENALSEMEDPQPLTPSHYEAVFGRDLLRTPSCARDVDLQLDRLLDRLDVTPRSTRVLEKLAKAAKQGQAELVLANREIGDLRWTADRHERRKEKLPGPKGAIWDKETGSKMWQEMKEKQEERNMGKKRTIVRKRMLEELQKDGTVTSKAKRLPKRFYGKVEALLAKEETINACASTEGSTSSEDEDMIVIKR